MKKENMALKFIDMLVSDTKTNPVEENLSILSGAIGKYVISRSIGEGINAGFVVRADRTGVVLRDARRLYFHRPLDKNLAWYEGVAVSGLHSDSKISGIVPEKYIIEDYSLIICSDAAKKSITGFISHGS